MNPTTTRPPTAPDAPLQAIVASLDALLEEVGRVGLDDAGWEVLTRRARSATGQLADTGRLPRSFVVALTDPPVVIARLLPVARAFATRPVATSATADRAPRCA